MKEIELTGEHNGRADHIISVGQVENFDKSNTADMSEIFFPTSLNIQLFRRVTDPRLPPGKFRGILGEFWGPK